MTVSEYLKYISLKRKKKVSFGLIVAKISAHGCLALVLWAVVAHGCRGPWQRNFVHLKTAGKQRETEGGQGPNIPFRRILMA